MEWENKIKAVEMTNEQWNRLTTYLIMTTQYREKEYKAWQELAEEKDENGNKMFQNAESNAEYWKGLIEDIEMITKIIDK